MYQINTDPDASNEDCIHAKDHSTIKEASKRCPSCMIRCGCVAWHGNDRLLEFTNIQCSVNTILATKTVSPEMNSPEKKQWQLTRLRTPRLQLASSDISAPPPRDHKCEHLPYISYLLFPIASPKAQPTKAVRLSWGHVAFLAQVVGEAAP